MPREKGKVLDFRDVRQAVADAKVAGKEYDIGDIQVPGLDLRVRGRTACWVLRGRVKGDPKARKWRIGDPAKIGIGAARDIADKAKGMAKAGHDPRDWLLEKETNQPVVHHDQAKDGWTWEHGRDEFLEFTLKERRGASYNDYRRTLTSQEHKDFEPFEGKLLKHVTEDDVKCLQDKIAKRAPVQARKTVVIVKRMLNYCRARGGSGIKDNVAAEVTSEVLGRDLDDDERLGRVPSIDEISDLFWQVARSNNPAARIAACMMQITAQRILTVRSARVQDFAPTGDGSCGLWTIPRPAMKVRKGRQGEPHVVPLPPVAWHLVQQAIAMLPSGSYWLFPQARERRVGSGDGGHMAHNTVRNALASGGSNVGPHDCRRGFATYGESKLGNTRPETKMILDHGETKVTDLYALHNGTHITWSIMRKWEAWLMRLCSDRQPPTETRPAPLFLCPPIAGQQPAPPEDIRGRLTVYANER